MKNQNGGKVDKLTVGLGVGLVASILLNVGLGVQLGTSNGPSDEYDGQAATDASFYEEQVKDLQKENEALIEQARNLGMPTDPTAEGAESESESEKEASEPAASAVDQNREAALATVSGFLDAYLNMDTSNVDNDARRAELDPYLNDELLGQLAPNAEELADMGIEGHSHEGEVENATPEYVYTQELTNKQIFIDDASLNTDTINVVAETVSRVEDNADAEYDLNDRYSFTLQKEGDNWVIVDYVLEAIDTVSE